MEISKRRRIIMEGITLHCIRVYRNKKTNAFLVEGSAITGDNLFERMKGVIEIEAKSFANEWDLISVSHALLPFQVINQI